MMLLEYMKTIIFNYIFYIEKSYSIYMLVNIYFINSPYWLFFENNYGMGCFAHMRKRNLYILDAISFHHLS